MDALNKVKSWIGGLTDIGLMLLALAIVGRFWSDQTCRSLVTSPAISWLWSRASETAVLSG
jgi:hypothetical protein